MTPAYALQPIDPADLASARHQGVDAHGNEVTPFVDRHGGEQLRCCLRRSAPGERLILVAHAPLGVHSPWREVGPVFVHADVCTARPELSEVPAWFNDADRVLRAYTSDGVMHHPGNRVVRAGDGVAAALGDILADPAVAEVHVRNLLAQCFIARAVRTP